MATKDWGERREAERVGRRASMRRTALVGLGLLLLEVPMLLAVRGGPDAEDLVDSCTVPARLSLIVELGVTAAVALLAVRAYEFVRMTADDDRRILAKWLRWVVLGAAGLNVVENVVLWRRADSVTGTAGPCSPLWVEDVGFTFPLSFILHVPGLAALGLLGIVVAAEAHSWRARRTGGPDGLSGQPVRSAPSLSPPDGSVICCSGGGIRSASFCLGGLQELTKEGIYGRARTVFGVSGGGYIAAAYHALRVPYAVQDDHDGAESFAAEMPYVPGASVSDPSTPTCQSPMIFGSTSPELARLRRKTRYLASGAPVVTFAALSLVFGLAVNLLLLLVLLRLFSWILGWLLSDAGALIGLASAESTVAFKGQWSWVEYVWVVAAAGVLFFLVEKVVYERFKAPGHRWVEGTRAVGVVLVWVGAAVSTVLLLVPVSISGLHNMATTNQPTPEVAAALHAIGFASPNACGMAFNAAMERAAEPGGERTFGSCGETATTTDPEVSDPEFDRSETSGIGGGLLAIVLSLLAAIPSAQSAGRGQKEFVGRFANLLARVWRPVRDTVLPWTATAVVTTTLVVVALRWTQDYATYTDQRKNWSLLLYGVAALVLIRILTDANSTSLHHFYRERLSKAYLVRRQGGRAVNFPYGKPLRLSTSAPTSGPRLVLCAAANVADSEWIPTDRNCTSFVFTHDRIGFTDQTLPGGGCAPASVAYEVAADWGCRDATIPAAVAISGAAFSPMTGRKNAQSRPYRMLLALANARLGVWLPNPYWVDPVKVTRQLVRARKPDAIPAVETLSGPEREQLMEKLSPRQRSWLDSGGAVETSASSWWELKRVKGWRFVTWGHSYLDKPGPFRLFKEAVGKASLFDRKVYVTDGGHYDNLGLVEALRSRPRYIYVLDASADREDSFEALGHAIATARMDLDVDVTFDPRTMKKVEEGRAKAAWGHGTACHRVDGTITDIYLAKVVLVEGLPWDIETYLGRNPTFPRTSTGNQLYGEWDFEAYRELGRQLVHRLLIDESLVGRPWRSPSGDDPHITGEAAMAPMPARHMSLAIKLRRALLAILSVRSKWWRRRS